VGNVDEGFKDALGINKSNPVIVFIPTQEKNSKPLKDAKMWLNAGITLLNELFGGATVMTVQGCWFNPETEGIVRKDVNLVCYFRFDRRRKESGQFPEISQFLAQNGSRSQSR